MPPNQSRQKISDVLDALGISFDLIARKGLQFHQEAQELLVAEVDAQGKEYFLIPEATQAWHRLKQAARRDEIVVEIVSAFRSVERQIDIIRVKLDRGMPIETILTLSAPPGYSEHHTGRAVDINTPGCIATEEPFEHTDAFRWLQTHASRFGFHLSYPRGNTSGFIYEPWHWCFHEGTATV
ncbi:MAG: D-alanyl-D-alanine carboxypeptidase [Burkholderiales bacterium RIFCSPLOWO2_02_FULL_57_36]|nr:MAG: D-alanyl-D-alanine carboxypeptidase [Burkholderiales bacterium RIFCSPLOWO2_02_FULL_57_36]